MARSDDGGHQSDRRQDQGGAGVVAQEGRGPRHEGGQRLDSQFACQSRQRQRRRVVAPVVVVVAVAATLEPSPS